MLTKPAGPKISRSVCWDDPPHTGATRRLQRPIKRSQPSLVVNIFASASDLLLLWGVVAMVA